MRVRAAPPPTTGGSSEGPLALLLRARRFRVAADAEIVRANLLQFGAEVGGDAPVFIGHGRPPPAMPSLCLGEHAATLGPGSGGFVNLLDQIVAWHAPVTKLPRRGKLAAVVARPDDLPDFVTLAVQRDLGLSWIISTGAGDPASVLRFLNADRQTEAILFAPDPALDGRTLRAALGVKPVALFGGSPLVQALVRRGHGAVTDRLLDWLLAAELLRAPQLAAPTSRVIVVGGGGGFVRRAFESAGASRALEVVDGPAALGEALAAGGAEGAAIVLHTGPLAVPESWRERALLLDWSGGDVLDALAIQLRDRAQPAQPTPEVTIDRALRDRVRAEIDVELDDHECKRLLKAYGARVTRQAPTNTPTGALKLARTIGLPVVLVRQDHEKLCASLPEVRQQAALLLDLPPDERETRLQLPPSIMVRERVPESPRSRIKVHFDRELGPLLRVGGDVGLLPLDGEEARRLAAATQARRAVAQAQVASLLYVIGRVAVEERVAFELELFISPEPIIVKAEGRRRPARDGEPEDEP